MRERVRLSDGRSRASHSRRHFGEQGEIGLDRRSAGQFDPAGGSRAASGVCVALGAIGRQSVASGLDDVLGVALRDRHPSATNPFGRQREVDAPARDRPFAHRRSFRRFSFLGDRDAPDFADGARPPASLWAAQGGLTAARGRAPATERRVLTFSEAGPSSVGSWRCVQPFRDFFARSDAGAAPTAARRLQLRKIV